MDSTGNLPGGVTVASGFQAGAAAAGIKYKQKKDIALIYSAVPAVAAGVFTTNKVKAAPLLVTMQRISGGKAQAIVVNSGNANACNGEQGVRDAQEMAAAAAGALGIPEELVLVASTGVIGQKLPMDKVLPGVLAAAGAISPAGGALAAEAIMTTDTFPKEATRQIEINGKIVTIGGMAKGAGMIHPNMATMLCFITTDAAIAVADLTRALGHAVEQSFNMITIDQDTSTNDMLVVLANGLAGNAEIVGESDAFQLFQDALTDVCTSLAMDIAKDGEGATKLIQVEVHHALTIADARRAARAVAGSNLVKAAVFGRDANWGRIICAAGYSGANFDPNLVDIFLGDEQVTSNGCSLDFSEERALEFLNNDTVRIILDFKAGGAGAVAWGCDLTYDYVRINGDYRT
ncbi:MAG: bifunctional glutamate N-acetyltransferase/amino-acid acetyltransferase ArgJ [Desulfotomaculaceae bacterium]|nr:bifunctional glutamate N-acetyltransferase/amino-acid acetyltransferase ArgJ [Desulfotomaculaceae bacterium]